jgi:hypothetical protein
MFSQNGDYAKLNQETVHFHITFKNKQINTKLRGLSPQANYTNRVTATCQRS